MVKFPAVSCCIQSDTKNLTWLGSKAASWEGILTCDVNVGRMNNARLFAPGIPLIDQPGFMSPGVTLMIHLIFPAHHGSSCWRVIDLNDQRLFHTRATPTKFWLVVSNSWTIYMRQLGCCLKLPTAKHGTKNTEINIWCVYIYILWMLYPD